MSEETRMDEIVEELQTSAEETKPCHCDKGHCILHGGNLRLSFHCKARQVPTDDQLAEGFEEWWNARDVDLGTYKGEAKAAWIASRKAQKAGK